MFTAIVFMVATTLLGVHNGYWLVAVVLTLTAGFLLIKYIFKNVLPKTMGETRPITGLMCSLGAVSFTCLLLVMFWGVSVFSGIAVKYDCLPLKI
jgi:general stress protein CsbA